ncbi:12034_t:CDS:1, partial [Gigaspora margarita]
QKEKADFAKENCVTYGQPIMVINKKYLDEKHYAEALYFSL